MGFWPYLRHAQRSEETPPSATGTSHTTFFSWLFLLRAVRPPISTVLHTKSRAKQK
jgi:hypothetical protein